MLIWTNYASGSLTIYDLGEIPSFLNEADPRPAKEQFHDNYSHGGGWSPFSGFVLSSDGMSIQYQAGGAHQVDDPLFAIFETKLRDERIVVFPYAWVMIQSKDGSYEISRMD